MKSFDALEKFQANEKAERRAYERLMADTRSEIEVLEKEIKAADLMSDPKRRAKAEKLIEERKGWLADQQAALDAITPAPLVQAALAEAEEAQAQLRQEFNDIMAQVADAQAHYIDLIKAAEVKCHDHAKIGKLWARAKKIETGQDELPAHDPKLPDWSLLTITQTDIRSGKAPMAVKVAKDQVTQKNVARMTLRDRIPRTAIAMTDEELRQHFGITREDVWKAYPEAAPPPPLRKARGNFSEKVKV